MPVIEDWMTKPLLIVNSIFGENKDESFEHFVKQVENYFDQRLNAESMLMIPSLNNVSLDEMRSGSLVKYRCMVQDVFDPQFCLGAYTVHNLKTQKTRFECGAFRDFPILQPDERVDFDSNENVTVDRQSFYCVPIPGEAEWVKKGYITKDVERRKQSSSQDSGHSKRDREIDDEQEISEKISKGESSHGIHDQRLPETVAKDASTSIDNSLKEADSVSTNKAVAANDVCLNFPLPGEKGLPCIIRVYSRNIELKATDMIEVVGILSLDPQLAAIHDDTQEDSIDNDELQAHEPPPSLVPRLHAFVIRPLEHNNPHLPLLTKSDRYKQASSCLMQDVCSLRLELLSVLEHALLGDRLAAEYLLCHLMSSVYARADVLPLGKLCLNISNCPATQRYTKFFNHLISNLTCQSLFLEMSIENANSWKLTPKKDYKLNRINAGMLQLGSGTNLVLDETALHQGQLNHTGVMNVKTIAELINWQKVDYDFEFHPIPVHTDINVLILSEGESLLPKDVIIPLSVSEENVDFPEHFQKLDARLSPENLDKLRCYLTACRFVDYEISEETQKLIQDDFVETRQSNPKEMTIEDFQRMLGIVRILTQSFGKTSPTVEMWHQVRSMEEERKVRLSKQQRNVNPPQNNV